jgi:hypothetical protein
LRACFSQGVIAGHASMYKISSGWGGGSGQVSPPTAEQRWNHFLLRIWARLGRVCNRLRHIYNIESPFCTSAITRSTVAMRTTYNTLAHTSAEL